MSQPNNPYQGNPHAKAASAYGDHAQAHTTNQRELEARVLQKSNRMLQDLVDNWDNLPPALLEETLKYNRQIWVLFYDAAIENKDGNRPNDFRSNIVNLANFIFKREMDILANPSKEKINILITINREISAGLMSNAQSASAHQQQPPPQQPDTTQKTDISS